MVGGRDIVERGLEDVADHGHGGLGGHRRHRCAMAAPDAPDANDSNLVVIHRLNEARANRSYISVEFCLFPGVVLESFRIFAGGEGQRSTDRC